MTARELTKTLHGYWCGSYGTACWPGAEGPMPQPQCFGPRLPAPRATEVAWRST